MDKILREVPFDPKKGYPVGPHRYFKGYPVGPHRFYKCLICSEVLPSRPKDSMQCRCGNVFIDVDAGRMGARDESKIRLLEEPGHPIRNAIERAFWALTPINDFVVKLTRPPRFRR